MGTWPTYAFDLHLPAPGIRITLSEQYNPPVLKGIRVYPDNPLRFDFILDQGDEKDSRVESAKLIKYFLASLTVPQKDLWVNLSPYEKGRIIPQSFGLTRMGRDLLAEDYMLKQITASLIYPEGKVGRKFWAKVYQEAAQKFRTTNIPVNTFNKVWIVPQKAVIYENAKAGTAYVVEAKLKVLLEQDYLSMEKHVQKPGSAISSLGSQIIREIVLPQLTTEVNEGRNFAQLRQVYNSLILADWYKRKIKDSLLSKIYEDKNKINGVGYANGSNIQAIYRRYLQAFRKGVYNYIKEDQINGQPVVRKYFSGGADLEKIDFAMSQSAPETLNHSVEIGVKLGAALDGESPLAHGFEHFLMVHMHPGFRMADLGSGWIGQFAENVRHLLSQNGVPQSSYSIVSVDKDVHVRPPDIMADFSSPLERKEAGLNDESMDLVTINNISSPSLALAGAVLLKPNGSLLITFAQKDIQEDAPRIMKDTVKILDSYGYKTEIVRMPSDYPQSNDKYHSYHSHARMLVVTKQGLNVDNYAGNFIARLSRRQNYVLAAKFDAGFGYTINPFQIDHEGGPLVLELDQYLENLLQRLQEPVRQKILDMAIARARGRQDHAMIGDLLWRIGIIRRVAMAVVDALSPPIDPHLRNERIRQLILQRRAVKLAANAAIKERVKAFRKKRLRGQLADQMNGRRKENGREIKATLGFQPPARESKQTSGNRKHGGINQNQHPHTPNATQTALFMALILSTNEELEAEIVPYSDPRSFIQVYAHELGMSERRLEAALNTLVGEEGFGHFDTFERYFKARKRGVHSSKDLEAFDMLEQPIPDITSANGFPRLFLLKSGRYINKRRKIDEQVRKAVRKVWLIEQAIDQGLMEPKSISPFTQYPNGVYRVPLQDNWGVYFRIFKEDNTILIFGHNNLSKTHDGDEDLKLAFSTYEFEFDANTVSRWQDMVRKANGKGMVDLGDLAIVSNSLLQHNGPGGIDLSSEKALSVQNNGGEIRFHLDPAMLAQWQNSTGVSFSITHFKPISNIHAWLGLAH